MYPSLPEEEAQTSVVPHAVTLEADIAAPIQVIGGSLRCVVPSRFVLEFDVAQSPAT
jgi:hypothetical protein